ncbi:DMT family transporter, partial [Streptomyces sp. NPDC004976]
EAVPAARSGAEPAGRGTADPAALLLAELTLPEDVRLPALPVPPAGDRTDGPDPAPVPLVSYAPFYGGPYVPVPAVDRHRTRVKS